MNLVTSEVERYVKKYYHDINVQVDLESAEPLLLFVSGKYEDYSSLTVFLSGQEIIKLLELNGILGEHGEVKKIIDSDESKKDERIHDLIYDTVAKYVSQMLVAASGKDMFPDLKALPQHKDSYFRRYDQEY